MADPDGESWRVDVILDDLAVPEEHRDKPLRSLSGGWQRTALLARAAMAEPEILLLDRNDAGSRPDLPTFERSGDRRRRSGQQSLLNGQI